MSEYFFRRYCNGTRMAEDVRIIQATTLEEACLSASRIAAQYKDGTALVYEPDSELWAHKQLAQDRVLIDALRAELAAEREKGWKAHAANLSLEEDNDALRALLRKCDEAMSWELGGEPMPTMMIEARKEIKAALKGDGDGVDA